MESIIERLVSPETARNLSLLLAAATLAWPPVLALLSRAASTKATYDFLVCGVGLLALLRFDAAMVMYATSAFPPESAWLRVTLPGIAAAMYAATWSMLFGSFLPWVFKRSDAFDAPQTWRERLAGGLVATAAAYLVAFFVAPLPSALEQALGAARAEQAAREHRARSASDGQFLVVADAVCTSGLRLYLDARAGEPLGDASVTARVVSELNAWRTGLGLPTFSTRSFHVRCADAVARKHPSQIRQLMTQWTDLSARLVKAGIGVPLPHWPELGERAPEGAFTEGQVVLDLSAYVSRAFSKPGDQVQYALSRTDGATIFQLVMELVLVLMAWPVTRVGRAPEAFQAETPVVGGDPANGLGGRA
jgi:hypothetical protein